MIVGSHPDRHPTRFYGCFSYRPRWGISRRGVVALSLVTIGLAGLLVTSVYRFLAPSERVNCRVLVVEGWINQFAIRAAAEEFKNSGYDRIYTTGGPVSGSGGYINDYNTSASVGAANLRRAGVPAELVKMVPSRVVDRDRTFHSAVALREWLRQNDPSVQSFNIATESVHARRTRLLFQKAFPPEMKIGIIAIPNPDYDESRWWKYSEGVREVLGETIAYIYARFFFYP